MDLQQAKEFILRTDERNKASMALYQKLAFIPLGVKDPEYPERIYLSRRRK
jgi:RimJ/RimL family protein N-acetyltransferase